jgi:hypothetical protein
MKTRPSHTTYTCCSIQYFNVMPYDRVMSKEPVRILDGLFSAEMQS